MTTTQTNEYTARIAARGAQTTAPDRPDAVDAEIMFNGAVIGDVTLLERRWDGELDTWGDLSMWASDGVIAHLASRDNDDDDLGRLGVIAEIVRAVQDAAK